MDLKERIIAYILAHHPITYDRLEEVTMGKGFNQLQIMDAMEQVHRDKRVTQTTHGNTIQYRPYIAPPVKEHFKSTIPYPPMDETNNADHPAFADLDYRYLFLTPEELDKYKAEVKGVAYYPKKRYEHTRRHNPIKNPEVLTSTQRALLAQSAFDV